jgi:predicted Rossmann fold nucleotide-binding protein DprA/Smf involved in DNA uptake
MCCLTLSPSDGRYPARLRERLGGDAPAQLFALGNVDLLTLPATALFCSARCPGDAILRSHDQAAHWRDAGRCVISGFHSPIEKECLRILLRGKPPIIVGLARSIEKLRMPAEWRAPLNEGRLLILSGFPPGHSRVTAGLAVRRNLIAAALADEHWFAHITPGGQSEQLARVIAGWAPGSCS